MEPTKYLTETKSSSHIQCEICKKYFKNRFILKKHCDQIHEIKLNHKDIPQPSPSLPNSSSEKAPIPIPKPFLCGICDLTFANLSQLRNHYTSHDPNKTHGCLVCGKHFSKSYSLQLHMETHKLSSQRHLPRHFCSKCPRSFAKAHAFREHRRLHEEESEKSKCDICQKTFKELKIHLATHNKMHGCELCGRWFSRKEALVSHTLTLHPVDGIIPEEGSRAESVAPSTGGNKFICQDCGEIFNEEEPFKLHSRMHLAQRKYGSKTYGQKRIV